MHRRLVFSPWQNIVCPFYVIFLKHHKGVALNGENIWRLPSPGHHIDAARSENFLFKWWNSWLLRDSARFFTTNTNTDAARIKDFPDTLSLSQGAAHASLIKPTTVTVCERESFPEPSIFRMEGNILEMNFTDDRAAGHVRLLNLRVIYIYCEACEIWIKNRYWYNRRSEWRWTDPFKDLKLLGKKIKTPTKRRKEKFFLRWL